MLMCGAVRCCVMRSMRCSDRQPATLGHSAAAMSAAASVDVGAPVARKKRVRKQKSEAEQDDAAAQHDDAAAEAATAAAASSSSASHASKKAKKNKDGAAASSASSFSIDTVGAEDSMNDDAAAAAASSTDAAAASSADDAAAAEKVDTSKSGSGYLSQETLNYYKQLAEVLTKNEFENEEGRRNSSTSGDGRAERESTSALAAKSMRASSGMLS